MEIMVSIIFFMFLMGGLGFGLNRKHLLVMLLSLEFIVLSLLLFLFWVLCNFNYEFYFSMVYIIFSVCEGVMGLSLLVYLVRTHGNDYFLSFNLLW